VVKGAYAELPRYFPDAKRVMDLETRLVYCMVSQQGYSESDALRNTFGNGSAHRSDRATDRAGDTRYQCAARAARAASARRTDRPAGGILRRHRSVARRAGIAAGRRRPSCSANAGQGRAAGAARRPRR